VVAPPRLSMAAACCRSSCRFAHAAPARAFRSFLGTRDVRQQAAAGRITVIAAAGINADCAADVVAACCSQSMQLPLPASPVWIHMSGSALVPTAADPDLMYRPFQLRISISSAIERRSIVPM
jgi:hypothetical protein